MAGNGTELARRLSEIVSDRTAKLYDRTWRDGVVDSVTNDATCDVLVDGHDEPTSALVCLTSYSPRVGDRVMVMSAGQSGADLLVLGPVGPPIGEWESPTLINNWQNAGSPLVNAQYTKDSQGFVHFKGTIQRTSDGTAVAFVLPDGYRPPKNVNIGAIRGIAHSVFGTTGRRFPMIIYANGNVEPNIGSGLGTTEQRRAVLSGIHFRAGS